MLSVVSARLPSGDAPTCGVPLVPYVLVRRGDAPGALSGDDVPEEGTPAAADVRFSLRFRWYRSVLHRGSALCWVHPDREATIQCVLCLRGAGRGSDASRKSYHCGPDCLRGHWGYHKDLHAERLRVANGDAPPTNGYASLSDAYYKAGGAAGGGAGGAGGGLGASGSGEAWVEVGRGRAFTPGPEDVGSALRVEVACIDGAAGGPYGGGLGAEVGRPVSVATARVRPAPAPPRRALVPLPGAGDASSPGSPVPGRFTVLTYNTLADLYAQPDAHPACPAWALAWPYRRQALVRELVALAPDILCLQEVQSNHYAEWWAPELHRAGYTGVYKKKTGALYTGGASFASDGCATFFKRGRFALVKKYEVEFNKAAMSLADGLPPASRGPALTRLLKDNVALIAVLEALDAAAPVGSASASSPPRRQLVCVANTHIHANPELNDVKLWQVHTLLKGLEKIAASADVPMVLAGDFNSTPGSAAHRLLTTGRVDAGHPDLASDPLGILAPASKLAHGLPLASAYAAALALPKPGGGGDGKPSVATPGPAGAAVRLAAGVDASTGEPILTNAGRDFRGTLDYIMYAADALAPAALLELPLFEGGGGGGGGDAGSPSPRASAGVGAAAGASGRPPARPGAPVSSTSAPSASAPPVVSAAGLPSERWSSDHIALMAEFSYRPRGGGGGSTGVAPGA